MMSISLLAPNRTILLMTDDALYIYTAGSRGVKLIEAVPWEAENFEQNVSRILAKDCGGKSILVLNDMVEQHYRKEKVIKAGVSALDKRSIIKRKLNAAFSNYPVRAALPLKEKPPKGGSQQAADLYIFAAVPGSNQYIKTINVLKRSLLVVSGLCLLPVESSDMVHMLAQKLSKTKRSSATWTIFIGQHRGGGLRQIVTKNGELALTRLTPITEDFGNAEAWIQDVQGEFRATMSYLSRFGYQAEDGLNVIVVADPMLGSALEAEIDEGCNYHALGLQEAAKRLGVSLGMQADNHFCDVLHVAWSGRKQKFMLPMQALQIERLSRPRQMAAAGILFLFLGGAFLGYQLWNAAQGITEVQNDLELARKRNDQLSLQYEQEVERQEALGIDIELIQSSLIVHSDLNKQRVEPLTLFRGIAEGLGRDLRIDKIDTEKTAESSVRQGLRSLIPGNDSRQQIFQSVMTMTYPSTANIDRGNQEVRDLRDRLQSLLPQHEVRVTKFLKDYEYVEEIVVESGDLEREDVQQDFIAEITIIGRKPDEEQL